MAGTQTTERRGSNRINLEPGYTAVYLKVDGEAEILAGHVYDVSATGIRFELDQPLAVGHKVALVAVVPRLDTRETQWVGATGSVARVLNGRSELPRLATDPSATESAIDHDPGPVRIAVSFDKAVDWPEVMVTRENAAQADRVAIPRPRRAA